MATTAGPDSWLRLRIRVWTLDSNTPKSGAAWHAKNAAAAAALMIRRLDHTIHTVPSQHTRRARVRPDVPFLPAIATLWFCAYACSCVHC